ncbi:hypothetical protein NC651_028331 [Populus alba x Populus x berolinensis]|nr:hypothetical protein NC651_028331 [Populus alba x Populus x berolinensis]
MAIVHGQESRAQVEKWWRELSVGTVVRGKSAPWNTQVGFRRGLVGVVFVRKQSRMIKQGSWSRELKLLRGFKPPLERLQMLALPFTWLDPLSNSSRRSCPPLLLHPTKVPLP